MKITSFSSCPWLASSCKTHLLSALEFILVYWCLLSHLEILSLTKAFVLIFILFVWSVSPADPAWVDGWLLLHSLIYRPDTRWFNTNKGFLTFGQGVPTKGHLFRRMFFPRASCLRESRLSSVSLHTPRWWHLDVGISSPTYEHTPHSAKAGDPEKREPAHL